MGCNGTKVANGRPTEFTNRLKLNTECRLVLICSDEFIFYFQNIISKNFFGYSDLILFRPDQLGELFSTDMVILVYIKDSRLLVDNYNICRDNRKLIVVSRELFISDHLIGLNFLSVCPYVVLDDINDAQDWINILAPR